MSKPTLVMKCKLCKELYPVTHFKFQHIHLRNDIIQICEYCERRCRIAYLTNK